MKRELPRKYLREALDDKTLPYCWSGRRRFKSVEDVVKYFKPLALGFANGGKAKNFAIPPEAYLIISVSPSLFSPLFFLNLRSLSQSQASHCISNNSNKFIAVQGKRVLGNSKWNRSRAESEHHWR